MIEHSAGLIGLYHDIVNHPPYARYVCVDQLSSRKYAKVWNDDTKQIAPQSKIKRVVNRKLDDDLSIKSIKEEDRKPVEPGWAVITVGFTEPVKDVEVKLGGVAVKGSIRSEGRTWLGKDTIWAGSINIPDDGSLDGIQMISIKAKDKDRHYNNKGGDLDPKPKTPARRKCIKEKEKHWPNGTMRDVVLSYEWEGYEEGEDKNHSIFIRKKEEPVKSKSKDAWWLVIGLGNELDLFLCSRACAENKWGKGSIVDGPFDASSTYREWWEQISNQISNVRLSKFPSWNTRYLVGDYKGKTYNVNRFYHKLDGGAIEKR